MRFFLFLLSLCLQAQSFKPIFYTSPFGWYVEALTQSASIPATSLTALSGPGVYEIRYYLNQLTTCSTNKKASVMFTLNWSDNGGLRQFVSPSLDLSAPSTGGYMSGIVVLAPAAYIPVTSVNFLTTYTSACSNTPTYDLHLFLGWCYR